MSTEQLLKYLGHEPTEELINKIDAEFYIRKKNSNVLRLYQILDYFCAKHDLTQELLKSKSRERKIALARHEYFYASCYFDLGVVKIGELVNRHYTTVIYGRDLVQDFMDMQSKYKIEIAKDLEYLTYEQSKY